MTRKSNLACVILAAWAVALAATAGSEGALQGRCTAGFAGTSSLHDFAGTVESRPFAWAQRRNVVDGHRRVDGGLDFDVGAMTTGLRRRDENMRRMFDASAFPVIRASVDDADLDAARASCKLPVRVRIRNVEHEVVARLTDWTERDGGIAFTATVPLSLAAFELKAPRALVGMIRVGDRVEVTARIELTDSAALPSGRAAASRDRAPGVAGGPG